MKDEGLTLTGWPAVSVFFMLALTQVLTALVMSLPITWLVNHVFAANAIHGIFAMMEGPLCLSNPVWRFIRMNGTPEECSGAVVAPYQAD